MFLRQSLREVTKKYLLYKPIVKIVKFFIIVYHKPEPTMSGIFQTRLYNKLCIDSLNQSRIKYWIYDQGEWFIFFNLISVHAVMQYVLALKALCIIYLFKIKIVMTL